MYGPEFPIFSHNYLRCRVLPKLLNDRTTMFRYWSGIWRVSKAKKATARAVFFQQFNIAHCFTVEASNGSFYCGETKVTTEFEPHHFIKMGWMIGEALFDLLQMEINLATYEEERKLRKLSKKGSSTKLRGKNEEKQPKPEMLKMMKQIKKEEEQHLLENEEQEGRSDSESSEDDVNEVDMKKLKLEIIDRQN